MAFLSALILVVSVSSGIHPLHAISNTPTFVIGVSNPQDPLIIDIQSLTSSVTILPSVSSLSLVQSGSILFVDGSWLASTSSLNPLVISQIDQVILSSTPTITVRGSSTLLSSSMSHLLQWHVPGLTLISEGLRVTGSLPDGTKVSSMLQVVSGFDYAVQAEFNWANNLVTNTTTGGILPNASSTTLVRTWNGHVISPSDTSTASPFWKVISFLQFDTGDFYKPSGRLMSTFLFFQLQNSGSSQYGWDNLYFNQTIIPGIAISGWNSNWRTDQQFQLVHDLNSSTTTLVAHGPTSLFNSGPFNVNYQIGVTAGQMGAVVTSYQNQSYFLKHTNITDTSQDPDVSWIHDIGTRSSAGTLTFTVNPGTTIRYLLTDSPRVEFGVRTMFVLLSGNQVTNSTTVQYGTFPG